MIKQMTRDELLERICSGSRDLRIVDVLDRGHFGAEHIKGAISMPVDEIEARAKQVLDRDETVVVYCASFDCPASTRAAEKLTALGFTRVFDYKGGLLDYKEAGLPLEGSLHREAAREFPCPAETGVCEACAAS